MYKSISVSPLNFAPAVRQDMTIPDKVLIHDTTLREGEQAPGVIFNESNKIEIAKGLEELGVQQVEAGFPAVSSAERDTLKKIVSLGLDADIFGFARAVKGDIDAVIECETYGLVLSFPPSDLHLRYKLNIDREQYLERAVECVEYAKDHGLYITYSAEDSTRTGLDFLKKVFKTVVEAGVDRARIVDTMGCIIPTAMKYLVKEVMGAVDVPIEVHCHNDHNLATANSLAAVEVGASVISSSINGLGERAGLTATEDVIVDLCTLYGVRGFKTEKLYELCKMVERISGVPIPPSKPVTGSDMFSHVSGIHQHGVIVNPTTYEPYPPELVGQKRSFVIGKLSGHHAISMKLKQYGIKATDEGVKEIVRRVKVRSEERRSALTDEEFLKIAREVTGSGT